MTNNTKANELEQLRGLLFGDQAQQTEDRFDALERAINSIRRDNRQIRQAIEVEAMSRIQADSTQNDQLSSAMDSSLFELGHILMQHLESERQKRAVQFQALLKAIDGFRETQDKVTDHLIAHLQNERKARSAQFETLKAQLSVDQDNQDIVSSTLTAMLDDYAAKHAGNAEANEPEAVATS